MKILQIIQRNQLRGAEIFACQLSESLQKIGYEVDILILFGKETHSLSFSLPFYYLHANEKNRFLDWKGYGALHQFIESGNYDIVQANAGDTLKYAVVSKKLFGWKKTLCFRNANKISGFLTSGFKKMFNKWLMKEVDYVASVSKECMIDFLQCYPAFKNKIACLPIGTTLSTTGNVEGLLSIHKPALLHVGSFVPEKNHYGLIEIFSKVLQRHSSATLYLVGEGKTKPFIEQMVREKGMSDSVVFLGKRNDVPQIMKSCNVLLLPSLIEGLPGVILEAFSNRLPVITYDTGGIKEVVIDNETGYLIEKNDEQGFVNAIDKVLTNASEVMISNAHDLIHREYSINAIAERFNAFYQQMPH